MKHNRIIGMNTGNTPSLSVQEVAKELGCTISNVNKLIRTGTLIAHRNDNCRIYRVKEDYFYYWKNNR